jgi:GTP-binding protein
MTALKHQFTNITFLQSAHNMTQCPEDTGKEVAFAGRSNSGKSSVINVLGNNHKIARTSKSPGRTQLLNFFQVADNCRLVDLPGYGYARVPENIRQHWGVELQAYFTGRRSLAGLILVMDVRHPLKPFDVQMLSWCQTAGLPVHILLNKADKVPRSAGLRTLSEVISRYRPEYRATAQLFSVLKRSGIAELREKLCSWLA